MTDHSPENNTPLRSEDSSLTECRSGRSCWEVPT